LQYIHSKDKISLSFDYWWVLMLYVDLVDKLLKHEGVSLSTVVNYPCLRYRGEFVCMYLRNDDSLLVKITAERVNELINSGIGREFSPTGKKFREWVRVNDEHQDIFEQLMLEALDFAIQRKKLQR